MQLTRLANITKAGLVAIWRSTSICKLGQFEQNAEYS